MPGCRRLRRAARKLRNPVRGIAAAADGRAREADARWEGCTMAVNGHPQGRAGKVRGSEPTPREWVILLEIEKGQSNPAIARDLCLSPNTVKTHAQRAFGKLRVNNRTQAALLVRAL